MQGQWFTLLPQHIVILELDEIEGKLGGYIQVHQNPLPNQAPWVCERVGYIEIDAHEQSGKFKTDLIEKAKLGGKAPNVQVGWYIGEYKRNDATLHIRLRPNPDFGGHSETNAPQDLNLTKGSPQTGCPPNPMSWRQFKDYLDPNAWRECYIWRGQENSDWVLRSSFHRYRAGLAEYSRYCLDRFRPFVAAITKLKYDLSQSQDQIAFLSLIQHHGYPTPFLDWTSSPYIAAFFAFRNAQPAGSKYAAYFGLTSKNGVCHIKSRLNSFLDLRNSRY